MGAFSGGAELLTTGNAEIADTRATESELFAIDYCKIAQIKKEPITAPFTLWIRRQKPGINE